MSESNLYYVIFGYGFGWYHQNWQNFGTGIESLHNDVMEVWLSLGLVGVICYLAFLGRIAFLSLSIAKVGRTARIRTFRFPIYLIYAAVAGTFFYFIISFPYLSPLVIWRPFDIEADDLFRAATSCREGGLPREYQNETSDRFWNMCGRSRLRLRAATA